MAKVATEAGVAGQTGVAGAAKAAQIRQGRSAGPLRAVARRAADSTSTNAADTGETATAAARGDHEPAADSVRCAPYIRSAAATRAGKRRARAANAERPRSEGDASASAAVEAARGATGTTGATAVAFLWGRLIGASATDSDLQSLSWRHRKRGLRATTEAARHAQMSRPALTTGQVQSY